MEKKQFFILFFPWPWKIIWGEYFLTLETGNLPQNDPFKKNSPALIFCKNISTQKITAKVYSNCLSDKGVGEVNMCFQSSILAGNCSHISSLSRSILTPICSTLLHPQLSSNSTATKGEHPVSCGNQYAVSSQFSRHDDDDDEDVGLLWKQGQSKLPPATSSGIALCSASSCFTCICATCCWQTDY